MSKTINILIAPDKMKGTLSAREICEIIESVAKENEFVDANGNALIFNCTSLPLADGGDGSLEVLKDILQLQKINLTVKGPLLEPLESYYAIDGKGNAYIEMANAAGLVQVPAEKRNCRYTTSYGFGQLIHHAISNGIKKVFLFLGGSATCDAGIGMATALGYKFLDKNGQLVQPFGEQMQFVKTIEAPLDLEKIIDTEFITLCDVNNPILGPNGAASVFAPQKGASPEDVKVLEAGLTNIVTLMHCDRNFYGTMQPNKSHQNNLKTLIGGGAAGGMGLGTYYFLGSQLTEGTRTIMRLTKFAESIQYQDVVITAEGQIDTTTLQGKVPFGVALEAKKRGIPCYLVGGNIKLTEHQKEQLGTTKFYSLSDRVGKENAMSKAKLAFTQVANELLKDIAQNQTKY